MQYSNFFLCFFYNTIVDGAKACLIGKNLAAIFSFFSKGIVGKDNLRIGWMSLKKFFNNQIIFSLGEGTGTID